MATLRDILSASDVEDIALLNTLIERVTPSNEILNVKCRDITRNYFGDVEQIKDWYRSGNFLYIISFLTKLGHNEILDSKDTEAIPFMAWITKQLEMINNMEAKLVDYSEELQKEVEKMKLAGSDEMVKYGIINTIKTIADKPWEWDKVMRTPYLRVYTELIMNKERAEIDARRAKQNKKK